MTPTGCDEYLADPVTNATHLESCESCRAAAKELEALDKGLSSAKLQVERRATDPDALPLAPWEGASTRSWIAVIVVAAIVAGLGRGGFALLGIDPIEGFIAAMSGAASTGHIVAVAKSAPDFLANAPMHVHLMIFAAFILVNVLFVALLRRRLRGYDA